MVIAALHNIDVPLSKILMIQLGDIGDVVWSIPSFQAMKTAHPQAKLFVLTRKPNGDLLSDDRRIDRVMQVSPQSLPEEISFVLGLRKEKFRLVIDLRADDRGAFLSFLSGAPLRAALYYPGYTWRNRMFTHLVKPKPADERIYGAAEQSLKIIRGLGMKEETIIPRIFIAGEAKNKVKAMLPAENIDPAKGWVSINPFSRWSYKEWDVAKWRQLLAGIWERYSLPAVIVGSPKERQRAAALTAGVGFPIYNLAGKTSLPEMAALLQMSRLHIGVDSAAPHIAAAVGTPTLTIYGPTDWRDWAPLGETHRVVLPEMDCSPCYAKGCLGKGRSICLEAISTAKVQAAAEAMLG